jgi:hypothetical protein
MRYDPASGVWSTLASTSKSRNDRSSFVLDGCLYSAGGANAAGFCGELYDVVSDTWAAVSNMLEERTAGFGAVTIEPAAPAAAGEQDFFDSLIAKATASECDVEDYVF